MACHLAGISKLAAILSGPQFVKLYTHSHKYTHKNQTRIADHSFLNRFHDFMQNWKVECRFSFNRNTIPTDNTNRMADSSPFPGFFYPRTTILYQHSFSEITARISNWIHSLLWGMVICILTLTTPAVWISENGCVIISHCCIGMQFLIHDLNYIFAQLIWIVQNSHEDVLSVLIRISEIIWFVFCFWRYSRCLWSIMNMSHPVWIWVIRNYTK